MNFNENIDIDIDVNEKVDNIINLINLNNIEKLISCSQDLFTYDESQFIYQNILLQNYVDNNTLNEIIDSGIINQKIFNLGRKIFNLNDCILSMIFYIHNVFDKELFIKYDFKPNILLEDINCKFDFILLENLCKVDNIALFTKYYYSQNVISDDIVLNLLIDFKNKNDINYLEMISEKLIKSKIKFIDGYHSITKYAPNEIALNKLIIAFHKKYKNKLLLHFLIGTLRHPINYFIAIYNNVVVPEMFNNKTVEFFLNENNYLKKNSNSLRKILFKYKPIILFKKDPSFFERLNKKSTKLDILYNIVVDDPQSISIISEKINLMDHLFIYILIKLFEDESLTKDTYNILNEILGRYQMPLTNGYVILNNIIHNEKINFCKIFTEKYTNILSFLYDIGFNFNESIISASILKMLLSIQNFPKNLQVYLDEIIENGNLTVQQKNYIKYYFNDNLSENDVKFIIKELMLYNFNDEKILKLFDDIYSDHQKIQQKLNEFNIKLDNSGEKSEVLEKHGKHEKHGKFCNICYTNISNVHLADENDIKICSHAICETCAKNLLEYEFNTCPYCRKKFTKYTIITV